MLHIKKVVCIDKVNHERIRCPRLFRECTLHNYCYHENHNILYGSYYHPVLVTYLPPNTLSRLSQQCGLYRQLVRHPHSQSIKDKINRLQSYLPKSDTAPKVIDNTDEGNQIRLRKQRRDWRHRKKQYAKHKREHKMQMIKRHPHIIRVPNFRAAYADVTSRIFSALKAPFDSSNDVYSALPDLNSLSMSKECDWLTTFYIVNHVADKKSIPFLCKKMDLWKHLSNIVGCAVGTADLGCYDILQEIIWHPGYYPYFNYHHISIKQGKGFLKVYLNLCDQPLSIRYVVKM